MSESLQRNSKPEEAQKPCLSRDGYEFFTNTRKWVISRDRTLYLSWVDDLLDEPLRSSFIDLCKFYAEKYSGAHTANLNHKMKLFVLFCTENSTSMSSITTENLINYRPTLDVKREYLLGTLKGHFKQWHRLDLPGMPDEVIDLLNEWKFKGNRNGEAVATRSVTNGQLTDNELQALYDKLINAYGENKVTLRKYTILRLAIATGRRPSQLCDLRAKDLLLVEKNNSEAKQYFLEIPRRKQQGKRFREEVKRFAITEELGDILTKLIKANKKSFISVTGLTKLKNFGELPLFPDERKYSEFNKLNAKKLMDSEHLHLNTNQFYRILTTTVKKLGVISERTGKPLHVFPTRLRRTTGTRAGREGYGVLAIAEILDHSSIDHAHVYVDNVPESVDKINKAVAMQLGPIAQAFAGELVEDSSQAKRGDSQTSVIRDEDNALGNCGHYGFCGALGPIACYTCKQFQPWLNAPHNEVLRKLDADKERILAETGDETIASINDRTMLAVAQVIKMCDVRKKEIKKLTHE